MTIYAILQAANPVSKRTRKSSARRPRLNWPRPNLHPSARQQMMMDALFNLALAAAEEHGLA